MKSALLVPRRSCRPAPGQLASMLVCLLPGVTGCFFTGDINRAPRAEVQVMTTGPHYRGSTVTFSASKSADDDGDPIRVSWSARTCNAQRNICDPVFDERTELDLVSPFTVTIPAQRPGGEATGAIVVVAEVIDDRGARQQDQAFVDVLNRAPSLTLQTQGFASPATGGYPIGTAVRVVVAGSDPDGDALTYEWQHFPPSSSVPDNVRWEPIDDLTHELEADVTGLWTVEVTATDALGDATTERVQISMAADAPPCIGATDPPALPGARYIVERDAPPRRLAVLSVTDDLDVYPRAADSGDDSPLGNARFRWLMATPETGGAFVELAGLREASHLVDTSAHAPGDQLALRVEIDDRVGRELPCSEDRATCALGGDTCLQRVTWSMEVR